MAFSGLKWVKHLRRHAAHAMLEWRFVRERRSSTSVEFAIVGSLYFLVLLFAIEGGIFYIKVDTLDLATERASRLMILNNFATAPATSAALITDIVNSSGGTLQPLNLAVSVRMVAPISGTAAAPVGGFQSLPNTFDSSQYQYVPGACHLTTNETTKIVTSSNCTGGCATTKLGQADSGYLSTNFTTGVSTLNQIYTCSAGQDILVQVQLTDGTLAGIINKFFGPVISTLAFQAEPSIT
jgi:Flp pilus assembly protein TadG